MITTILFDVGGTLIHPDMSRLMAPLLARTHPTPEHLAAAERAAKCALRQNGDDSPRPDACELGAHAGLVNKGHWQLYFAALLQALGDCHDLLPELTARAGNSDFWTLVDPAAAPALAELQRHYRLAVVSNADGRIGNVLERAGLGHFFEKLIDSGRIGYEKPDPRIFCAALEQMGAKADESLYVGDIYAVDYRGATNAGMKAVLVDPNGMYRDWGVARLASLGELPGWVTSQP